MATNERVGVFGGTFDPVHIGHLVVAETMRVALQLARVLFLPAGRPPHKPILELSTDEHRIAMLELAIQSDPHFELSRIDIDRAGPSYTADSMEMLRLCLPASSEIMFIMGADSLRDLPIWHEPERIVAVARLAVATRPNVLVDVESICRQIPAAEGRITTVDIPLIGVSSSGIRDQVRRDGAFRYQVPPAVADYIVKHDLYRMESGRVPVG